MKICKTCKIEKGIEEYSKKSNYKDNLSPHCRNCEKEIKNKWYHNNKHKIIVKEKTLEQKEKIAIYKKQWKENNRELYKERKRIYKKKRKEIDPVYNLSERIRRRILKSFEVTKWAKHNTTQHILGCSFEELHKHIENQFTEGMSWDKMGKIHIDHIIPLATAKTEEDVIRLNHYTNLQPLWAVDNILKGSKIT